MVVGVSQERADRLRSLDGIAELIVNLLNEDEPDLEPTDTGQVAHELAVGKARGLIDERGMSDDHVIGFVRAVQEIIGLQGLDEIRSEESAGSHHKEAARRTGGG